MIRNDGSFRSPSGDRHSFTLVEVLVAMAIFIVLIGILFTIINQVANVMRQSTRQIETFQSARIGYELMTHTLSQATLNTYLDYDNSLFPTTYLRKADLDSSSARREARPGRAPFPARRARGRPFSSRRRSIIRPTSPRARTPAATAGSNRCSTPSATTSRSRPTAAFPRTCTRPRIPTAIA